MHDNLSRRCNINSNLALRNEVIKIYYSMLDIEAQLCYEHRRLMQESRENVEKLIKIMLA